MYRSFDDPVEPVRKGKDGTIKTHETRKQNKELEARKILYGRLRNHWHGGFFGQGLFFRGRQQRFFGLDGGHFP